MLVSILTRKFGYPSYLRKQLSVSLFIHPSVPTRTDPYRTHTDPYPTRTRLVPDSYQLVSDSYRLVSDLYRLVPDSYRLVPTRTKHLLLSEVDTSKSRPLRTAAHEQSQGGGQGFTKCGCTTSCNANNCKCFKSNVICNSRCHGKAPNVKCLNHN